MWSLDFLSGRRQFVKIADSVSSTSIVKARTPQSTVTGSYDLKLIINDLNFDLGYVKYIDHTTAFSISNNPCDCSLQKASDYLVSWTNVHGMLIKIPTKLKKSSSTSVSNVLTTYHHSVLIAGTLKQS